MASYDAIIVSTVEAMFGLLWGIVVVLVVFWLLGFSLHIAGSLIHLLLLLAIAVAIYNFATSRDARQ
jgi:uncharacterized membrane protein YccC